MGLGYIFDKRENNRSEALKEFFIQASCRGISIIGEPPEKTDSGEEGPAGGKRDLDYIVDLLKDSEYPLEINI